MTRTLTAPAPDPTLVLALEAAFGRLLGDSRTTVIAALNDQATTLVAAGTHVPDPSGFFDLDAWADTVDNQIGPILEQVVVDAAGRAAIASSFDLDDPRMQSAVARHVAGIESWSQDFRASVTATIEQGMAEGWSIETMASELTEHGSLADARAVTIARTEAIAAANAGTFEAWTAAGVIVGKVWEATNDDRTRDTHREAHGQHVALDAPFTVGGYTAEYPGDPNLPVQERVNCRCSMLAEVDDLPPVKKPVRRKRRRRPEAAALYREFANKEHDHRGRFAPKGTGVTKGTHGSRVRKSDVENLVAWEPGDTFDGNVDEALFQGADTWMSGYVSDLRRAARDITGIETTNPTPSPSQGFSRGQEARALLDGIEMAPPTTVHRGLVLSGEDADALLEGGTIADALATATTDINLATAFAEGEHGYPPPMGPDAVGVVVTYRDTPALPITPIHAAKTGKTSTSDLMIRADEHLISGKFRIDRDSIRPVDDYMVYVDAYPVSVAAGAGRTDDGYFVPPDDSDGGSITAVLTAEQEQDPTGKAAAYASFGNKEHDRRGRFAPKGQGVARRDEIAEQDRYIDEWMQARTDGRIAEALPDGVKFTGYQDSVDYLVAGEDSRATLRTGDRVATMTGPDGKTPVYLFENSGWSPTDPVFAEIVERHTAMNPGTTLKFVPDSSVMASVALSEPDTIHIGDRDTWSPSGWQEKMADGYIMPAAADVSMAEYVVTHETGHLNHGRLGSLRALQKLHEVQAMIQASAPEVSSLRDLGKFREWEASLRLSGYALSHPAEAIAESWAQLAITGESTGPAMDGIIEIMGWEKP